MEKVIDICKSSKDYDQSECLKTATWFAAIQKKKVLLQGSDHQAKNRKYFTSEKLLIKHRSKLSICNENMRNYSNTFIVGNEISDKKIIFLSSKSIH